MQANAAPAPGKREYPGGENNCFVATKISTHQKFHVNSPLNTISDTIQQENYSNYRVPDLSKR